MEISKLWESTPESWGMHWYLMNDHEFGTTKLWKFKYRRADQIIRTFCKIGFPKKLGRPSLKEYCWIMHNALKSNEWQSIWVYKTFEIQIQKGVQTIQTFCKIDFPQKLGVPSLTCRHFKTLKKVLLNHAECIKI